MAVESYASRQSAMLWGALATLKKLKTVHIDIRDPDGSLLEETFFKSISLMTQIR